MTKHMEYRDRFGRHWTLMLGEVEIQGSDGAYTLMAGFVMPDCGLYLRLWKDGCMVEGGYISDWQYMRREELTLYGRHIDRMIVDKCIEAASRLEKLKAFA